MTIKKGNICFYNFSGTGSVQRGRRPCVVVSNERANLYSNVITILPITSKIKNPLPTHTNIMLMSESTILAEQITTVEKEKLQITNLSASKEKLNDINHCLEIQLELSSKNLILENKRLKEELEFYKKLVLQNNLNKMK